ncbi:hypothetical protein JW898_04405 [Candidatus Woesearchaeota archaeon]|nr:hypothetical protein [Candidatus Woesearchaeota archaeon]
MGSLKTVTHTSGLLEISTDEPKGTLVGLLKAAKKEEKLLLTDTSSALKYSRRAIKLAKPYKTDIFGESFSIKGGFRYRRFKRLIKESLQLAISAKIHLPAIEMVANEVKAWLLSHKTDTTAAGLLPADEKVIAEVRKAKDLLESAVKNLTELDSIDWGTASGPTSFSISMHYVPVEHESKHEIGLKFRADWINPLRKSNDALEHFASAVENIFELQREINKKYRI